MNPIFRFRERRFPGAGRLVILQWRRHHRQLGFIKSAMFSIFPNNWERLAPITLPRKKPVAQFVTNTRSAVTALLQPRDDFLLRLRCRQSIDHRRVDREPVSEKTDGFLGGFSWRMN